MIITIITNEKKALTFTDVINIEISMATQLIGIKSNSFSKEGEFTWNKSGYDLVDLNKIFSLEIT